MKHRTTFSDTLVCILGLLVAATSVGQRTVTTDGDSRSSISSLSLDCGEFYAQAIHPLYVADAYSIYIEADDQVGNFVPTLIYASDSLGETFEAVRADEGGIAFVVDGLEANATYSLSYIDQCGGTHVFSSLETSFEKGKQIGVSDAFFDLLSDIGFSGKTEPASVYDQIMQSNKISYHAKASFLQQYFLKGEMIDRIEDVDNKDLVLSSRVTSNIASTCDCETVSTAWQSLPGSNSLKTTSGSIPEGPLNVQTNLDKLEYRLATAGASKSWWVYSDGYNEKVGITYGGAVGNASSSGVTDDNTSRLPTDFAQTSRLS